VRNTPLDHHPLIAWIVTAVEISIGLTGRSSFAATRSDRVGGGEGKRTNKTVDGGFGKGYINRR
jgi:hypothetical protein